MTKRVGILSLILAAGMAIFQPVAALAQDRDFHDRDRHHDDRGFRERRDFDRRDNRRERRDFEVRRDRYYDGRYNGYVYSAPRYYGGSYYYEPQRPYNCR